MRNGISYIRDSSHFLEKTSSIPDNAMLVTADLVGLYFSILHSADSNSLKRAFEKRVDKHAPTSDLVKMTEYVLSNNYFEFSEKVFQQMSGTAVQAQSLPLPACIHVSICTT